MRRRAAVVGVLVLAAAAAGIYGHLGQQLAGATASSVSSYLGAHAPPDSTATRRAPAPAPGTDRWRLSKPAVDHQIEGYALRAEVYSGQPVSLRVSTAAARFRVEAYRFGWYRGGQARMVWSSIWMPGRRQAGASFADRSMRTVVAPWRDSMAVPTDGWPAGAYLLKLVASSGWQSYVPLFVRSSTTAGTVALVAPVATWEAYNDWGGYSLYSGPPGDRRAWAVSFDRPFAGKGTGAADLLYGVRPVVIQAERTGVPLSYLTDLDLAAQPDVLAGARAYVSMGHDEYWTPSMRRTVLNARAHGTNLAFLGADIAFWRIRLAGSAVGPGRVVVGYRWDYRQDPMRSVQPALTTAPFGFSPDPRPQEVLTGTRYECYPVDAPYTVSSPGWWGFRGTGARAGDKFAHLVGIEADRVYPTTTTPRPLQILSSTPYSCRGVQTSAQSVYFTTPSGAGVFTAGTLRWTCALLRVCGAYQVSPAAERFTSRVTDNVLRVFAGGPAARQHPAHDNLAAYRLPSQHTVPAD